MIGANAQVGDFVICQAKADQGCVGCSRIGIIEKREAPESLKGWLIWYEMSMLNCPGTDENEPSFKTLRG